MPQETVRRQRERMGHPPVELFTCAQALPSTLNREAQIQTPRGTIRLDAMIDGVQISELPPIGIYTLPHGGCCLRWQHATFVAELLLARPRLELQYPRRLAPDAEIPWLVADCWAGVWRIKAGQRLGESIFTGRWDHGVPIGLAGGPGPGQWLAAQEWHDAEISVAMGTMDDEGRPYVATYLDDGLRVAVEGTPSGQQRQTHFLVAWGPYDEESVDTWLAVNFDSHTLVQNVGCSIRPD